MPKSKAEAKVENHATAKSARNAIAKSILDISELNIACNNGSIELWGKLRPPRGHTGVVNMRKEFENLKNLILSVRGVRDVQSGRVILLDS
jgi:hypothetical protein